MTPYILTTASRPSPAALSDLNQVKTFVSNLPDATKANAPSTRQRYSLPEDSYAWSCHGLCRAAARLTNLNWRVIDGWFLRPGNQHSWLFLELHGGAHRFVMDVYPIAQVGGPFLIDFGALSPWADAYIERNTAYSATERERFDQEGIEAVNAFHNLKK